MRSLAATVSVVLLIGCSAPGDSDAGPDAATDPVLSPTPVAVYVLGDSISAGIGASEPELAWGPLFHGRIDALTADTLDYENVAVPGATSAGLVNEQLDALAGRVGVPAGPVIVGITIGGNDLRAAIARNPLDVAGDTLDVVEQNLITTANWFSDTDRFPGGAAVYIANVYNPHAGSDVIEGSCYGWSEDKTLGPVVENILDAWTARYESTGADYGFTVVDARTAFADHSRYAEDTWFADCMHPNDAGHAAMSGLFFDASTKRP